MTPTRCQSTYPGAATLRGRPIRCEDRAGHDGQHGHSFAARWRVMMVPLLLRAGRLARSRDAYVASRGRVNRGRTGGPSLTPGSVPALLGRALGQTAIYEHPEPREVTYRADVPHGDYATWQNPMPPAHGRRRPDGCASCAREREDWQVIVRRTLREDHANGHAWSVDVNGAIISAPAHACPYTCPLHS